MGKRFDIIISATDKTTEAVKRVNERLAKINEPFQKVGASFKALGEELGVKKIGSSLKKVGVAARDTAGKIGAIVAPLAAISSVTSVAGMAALAANWAKLGQHVTFTAQAVGISTSQLQKMQQLGALSGVGADAMASSLETLGDTMEDARWGRNTGAMMMFNRLGIGLKRTAQGSWDVIGQMKAVAKAMNAPQLRNNPWAQKVIAQQFGLTAILPFLRQGEEGIARYEAMQQRLGYTMDAGKADRFAESLAGLKVAGEGLKNAIADSVMPVMRPFIDELAQWIAANRVLISQKVAEWAQKVGDWIKTIDWHQVGQDVTDLVKNIGKFIDALGGIKGTVIAVGIAMNAGLIASVVNLTAAIGVPMLKGIGAVVGKLWQWHKAATAVAEATEAATAASEAGAAAGGLGVAAKGLAGRAGLVGLAGLAGWETGGFINRHFVEGTSFGDKLGGTIATAMAAMGSKEAQEALDRETYAHALLTTPRVDYRHTTTPASTATAVPGTSPSAQALAFFEQQGWTHNQAAGLTANLLEESGLNPAIPGDRGAAYGIGQWHADRQRAFAAWAGKPIQGSTLMDQLGFVQHELTEGNEQRAGARLAATTTPEQAGATVSRYYERPAAVMAAMAKRGAMAGQLAGTAGAPAGPMMAAAATVPHETTILVDIPNAPPGTKVTATSPTDHITVKPAIGFPAVGAIAS